MKLILPFLASLIFFSTSEAAPPSWRASNFQVLFGNQYEIGPATRESITIEHASSWRWGESYFFTNVFNRRDVGTELYAEFYPRLSWQAVTGSRPTVPFLTDMSLVAGINAGNLPRQDPFTAYLAGIGFKFDAPMMDYLKLDLMAFKSDNIKTTGIQVSPIWGMQFELGRSRFLFKGFLDWQSHRATGGEETVLTQPQLLLDIGHFYGHTNQFYAGVEYSYWYNKFGIDGVIERVPQAMILVPF